MPCVGKGRKKGKKAKRRGAVATLPKKKCCESRKRCNRCPLRMLKEGTLPSGYTVHKRKLVTVEKAVALQAARQAEKADRVA